MYINGVVPFSRRLSFCRPPEGCGRFFPGWSDQRQIANMEDFELDDDGIVTDEEVEIPPVEVRVPSAWTAKMSAKALRQAAPMELPLLLPEVCGH